MSTYFIISVINLSSILHSMTLLTLNLHSVLGKITRQRTVARVPSCGGRACPSLSETGSCQQYNDAHCVMGNWGPWSVCDNGCGQGRARKTRQIIRKETCRGNKCGATEAFKVCTDYRNNRNCKVGDLQSKRVCEGSEDGCSRQPHHLMGNKMQ